jgi:hypothetical protein
MRDKGKHRETMGNSWKLMEIHCAKYAKGNKGYQIIN